jgi:hypothetical protein
MRVILIFIDGIGLGPDDPQTNPFAAMSAPTLHGLAGGQRWLASTPRTESDHAIFLPTDTVLGIEKLLPASGTGQATILTGRNIPQEIGEHYGPKPNEATRLILDQDNLFITLRDAGLQSAYITPYPSSLMAAIERRRRLPSSLQYAARAAQVPLRTETEYLAGQAISPDWTGQGWRDHLGFPDAPVYSPYEAGARLATLAQAYDFTFFSTWLTDEIGHRGTLAEGVAFMERTDEALRGLLDHWSLDEGLVVITSDHGNMEDMSRRKHTKNLIPTLAIGAGRGEFANGFHSLADITPGILRVLGV